MGQRLVIQNFTPFKKENQEEIFPTNAIYYHWSAYTESAIEEIKQLKRKIENYYDQFYDSTKNKLDFFNLACLNAVSGIAPQYKQSINYIENLLEKTYDTTKVDRSEGMIGFTEDDIDHIQYWSEGTVNIYWIFDEEGKPNFEKSTFDFWALLSSDTADAVTLRVKNAGGNVDGDVRVSLSWDNKDDLDLSVYKDNDEYDCIYYGRRRELGGELDVDANAHSIVDEPVENIFWKSINNLANGQYTVKVNNFNKRTNENQGFTLQFATTEGIQTFTYPDNDVNHKPFLVFEKENHKVKLIQISDKLQCQSNTVSGDKFIEVKNVLMSPNTWEKEVGNKHFILLTDDVEVNEPVRGFFNEQLNSKLSPHRKVTEILGSKLKIQAADFEPTDVAKGYGFSETMDANLILRLTHSNGRKELVHVSIK